MMGMVIKSPPLPTKQRASSGCQKYMSEFHIADIPVKFDKMTDERRSKKDRAFAGGATDRRDH